MKAFAADSAGPLPDGWSDPASGAIRWRMLVSQGLTDSDSLVAGVAELAPGDHFAAHHHAQAEIYFGVQGTGTVLIDGTPHNLAPGVLLFIPGGAVHSVPPVTQHLRYFYVFAADRFDDIVYHFA